MSNNIIKDVVVQFCHVGYPVLCYQKNAMEGKPFGNKEYVVDCLLPAATLRKIIKHYKKSSVKSFEKIKDYTAAEYEKAFKMKPPSDEKYQTEDADGDVTFRIMKFRAPAAYQDGEQNVKAIPKIVGVSSVKGANGSIYKDATGQIVGDKVAIGNGSVVNLHFSERGYTIKDSATKGLKLQLIGVQVSTLIPYEKDEGSFDIDEEQADEETGMESNDGFDVADGGNATESDESAAQGTDPETDPDEWDE